MRRTRSTRGAGGTHRRMRIREYVEGIALGLFFMAWMAEEIVVSKLEELLPMAGPLQRIRFSPWHALPSYPTDQTRTH